MKQRMLSMSWWLVAALVWAAPSRAITLVSEDFDDGCAAISSRWPDKSYIGFPCGGGEGPEGATTLVTSPVVSGAGALRQNFTGTQYDTPPHGGGAAQQDFGAANPGYRDIWITWYSRMSTGFKTAGGEISAGGLGGAGTKSIYLYMLSPSTGKQHGWVPNYMWGSHNLSPHAQGIKDAHPIQGGPIVPYDTEVFYCNVQCYWEPDDQWTGYEMHYRLNTPGQSDGLLEVYVTPQGGSTFLMTRYANREFVDSNNSGSMPGDSYWKWAKLYRQDGLGYIYWDRLRITTERIGFSGTPPAPAPDTSLPNAPTNLTVTELWEDLKALAATVWQWLGPSEALAATNDRVTITWPEIEPDTLYELRWHSFAHPDWIPLGRVPSEQAKVVIPLDPPVRCDAGQDCWRCADGRAIRDGRTGPWLSETAHGKACSQFTVGPIALPPLPPVPQPDPEPDLIGPAIVTMSGDKVFIACDPARYTKAKTTGTGTKRVITCLN